MRRRRAEATVLTPPRERALRAKLRPRVKQFDELWDHRGLLKAAFVESDMDAPDGPLVRRHRKAVIAAMKLGDDGYKVPRIVMIAYKAGDFIMCQVAQRYPWAVIAKTDDKVYYKKCETMLRAVEVHKKWVKKVPNATIISRVRGYDIPPELRGKMPPGWKWCPRCCKGRKFTVVSPAQHFYAERKEWDSSLGRYVWKERRLKLLECPMCGCTNRDAIFRRSNQPWETTKLRSQRPQRTKRQTSHIKRRR